MLLKGGEGEAKCACKFANGIFSAGTQPELRRIPGLGALSTGLSPPRAWCSSSQPLNNGYDKTDAAPLRHSSAQVQGPCRSSSSFECL